MWTRNCGLKFSFHTQTCVLEGISVKFSSRYAPSSRSLYCLCISLTISFIECTLVLTRCSLRCKFLLSFVSSSIFLSAASNCRSRPSTLFVYPWSLASISWGVLAGMISSFASSFVTLSPEIFWNSMSFPERERC